MEPRIDVAVVDDEEILLHAMANWLAPPGSGIHVIATAQSVDALLAQQLPSAVLVVLDLRLRDGRSPADNVRRLVAAGHPVIGCSSRDDPRWIRQAIDAGALSYVRKTKDPVELRTAIEAAARGDRYTSAAHAAALDAASERGTVTLSIQERETLRLYAAGMTIADVAAQMHIKTSTAKGYLDRVRDKYEDQGRKAHNKIELRERAVEDGVIPTASPYD